MCRLEAQQARLAPHGDNALSSDTCVRCAAWDMARERASERDACRGGEHVLPKVVVRAPIACTGAAHTQDATSACSQPFRLTRRQRSDSATTWTTIGTFEF